MKSDRKTRGFRNAHMHAPARLFATAAAALFTASCAELVDNPITSTYLLASSSPTAKAIYIKSLEAKQKSISERRRKIAEARAKMYDSLNNNDLREEAVKLYEKNPRHLTAAEAKRLAFLCYTLLRDGNPEEANNTAIFYYILAGEKGDPEGYYAAAIILKFSTANKDAKSIHYKLLMYMAAKYGSDKGKAEWEKVKKENLEEMKKNDPALAKYDTKTLEEFQFQEKIFQGVEKEFRADINRALNLRDIIQNELK